MAERAAVERDPRFEAACRTLWVLVERGGILEERDYLEMVVRFNYVVRFAVKRVGGGVERSAAADWDRDSLGASNPESGLSWAEFRSAIWEAVDVWTEGCDVEEYVALLERLIMATTLERFDGSLTWKPKPEVTFDAYFAVSGDERARAIAAERRGDAGYDLNQRFGAAVFVQRRWLAHREARAAKTIQTHYRKRAGPLVLTPTQTNRLIGRIYAKQIHMLAANRRSKDPVDRALRFDAFCLRFFMAMNGSPERAHAYLKIFITSVEGLLSAGRGDDGRVRAPRAAVFAELVGIRDDHFNGRLFHEYVLKVLAALYTEREATEKLAGQVGDAVPVARTAMRRALWQAMPPALRLSDAVKARVCQAVDGAAVGSDRLKLCDPDQALWNALDLYKAADLWYALRRRRAAHVLGLNVRAYLAREANKKSCSRALETLGRRIADKLDRMDPGFERKFALFERWARPRSSSGPKQRSPLRRRNSVSASGTRRLARACQRRRSFGSRGGAENAHPGLLSPSKLFSGIKISPRRKLDEALWRDLELNGGTDSILFELEKRRKTDIIHALQIQ